MPNETHIEQLNVLLERIVHGGPFPLLCLLTGASGAGKTHLATAVRARLDGRWSQVHFFDRIGVPSTHEMVADYGSPARWQEAKTHEWIERLAKLEEARLVVFEGQFHPRYAVEACARVGVKDYALAAVTCDEPVWEERLRGPRGQAHLVSDDMRNWARVLKEETLALGGSVIDTSDSNLERNLSDVARRVKPLLGRCTEQRAR